MSKKPNSAASNESTTNKLSTKAATVLVCVLAALLASCGSGASTSELQAAFESRLSQAAPAARHGKYDPACAAKAIVSSVGADALVEKHGATVESIEAGTFSLVLDEQTANTIAEKQFKCGEPIRVMLSAQQFPEEAISCGVEKLDKDLILQVIAADFRGEEGRALVSEAFTKIEAQLVAEGCVAE